LGASDTGLASEASAHGSKICYTSSVILGLGVSPMRRREFITLLGGALTSRPFPANAQPAPRMRTVGALIGLADDAEARARSMAFEQGLEKEG